MLKAILGKKVGMIHIFRGVDQIPVSVVEAGPVNIVQKKVTEKEGYEACQISFGAKKPSRVNKAATGHFAKSGSPAAYHLREVGADDIDSLQVGSEVKCSDVFEVGDFVDVSAKSKGRGFAGVLKRWNFKGGPGGHGSKHGRESGSIGQSSNPSKVMKGMKMAGQMGNKRITTQNLEVVGIRPEENIMLIKGALPGAIGSLVEIRKAIKKTAKAG